MGIIRLAHSPEDPTRRIRSLTWPERRIMLRSIVDAMWEEDLASSDVFDGWM